MVKTDEYYSLRIFIGENDTYGGLLLYQWLVNQAREQGLAGSNRSA